ncbi:YjgN family protein [Rhizobium aegyptiacum]|uniref:YjgN family protein n=1 Tax=Rhizobium aegyptiacum TaxID=1764550 RepID=UPI0007E582A7|nr:YjgN family protein [Rhizobium aegyptiacum]
MDNRVSAGSAANAFERARFTGTASEYFGIWIVNVLLTIITLGIYSAWAKVRRNRYFYGNTVLLGRSFEYHATGKQIFIGRVIVFAFIVVANILATIHPLFSVVTTILVLIALPWLIVRGLRFNARVTSYRNVRFDFTGTAGGAFVSVLLGSFVAFLSLGLLAPFASRWVNRYFFNNLRYGNRPFHTDPKVRALYGALLVPALMVVLGAVLLAGLIAIVLVGLHAWEGGSVATEAAMFTVVLSGMYVVVFGLLIIYGLAGLIYRAAVHNIVWSSTRIDGRHVLRSDLSRARYAWIAISNVVVTVLTLGLMRPWAAVRLARYVTEHTAIHIDGEIGEVFTQFQASGTAISSEYISMEGIDFGF